MQGQCSYACSQRMFSIVVTAQKWSLPAPRHGCHRRCFKRDGGGCDDIIALLPFPDAIA